MRRLSAIGHAMRTPWRATVIVLLFLLCSEIANSRHNTCPNLPSVLWAPPHLMESMTTGALNFEPYLLYQHYRTICHKKEVTPYRTIDGSCNHAFNLGTANTPLNRMLPAEYGDGINIPRYKGVKGTILPSATEVSRLVHRHEDTFDKRSIMLMQWGQFIDHDFSLSPVGVRDEEGEKGDPNCCMSNMTDTRVCMPIWLNDNDHRFAKSCMEFTRSIPALRPSGDQMIPREQVNVVTSFIDASPVYGSSEEVLKQLRYRSKSPYLRMNRTHGLLPRSREKDCIHRPGHYCFLAGDTRVNEQPGLSVLHTIINKMHNRIVDKLRKEFLSRGTTPDRLKVFAEMINKDILFQETRKIVIAIIENIHYGEWLPLVLGSKVMDAFHLRTGKRVSYSGSVDPRILNAFSTAAFRFGHSLIPEGYDIGGKIIPLRKVFNSPDPLFDDLKGIIKSLMKPDFESQKIDGNIVKEVTDHLFEPKDQDPDMPSKGLDLVALNIQRGRDHGLPPYNKYRKLCGLPAIENFFWFGQEAGSALASLYESVEDIDLFTGGMLEPPVEVGCVGYTFACIMAVQFHALKFGDRFFFETVRMPEGFTDAQLASIRNVTLAHVLCFFSEDVFPEVQERCFESPSAK